MKAQDDKGHLGDDEHGVDGQLVLARQQRCADGGVERAAVLCGERHPDVPGPAGVRALVRVAVRRQDVVDVEADHLHAGPV